MWDKALGLPGLPNMVIQVINFLESKPFRLIDKEGNENHTAEAAGTPNEEDLDSQTSRSRSRVDEIRCRVAESPVEEPIGGDRACDGLGSELKWENLADNDPPHWTP